MIFYILMTLSVVSFLLWVPNSLAIWFGFGRIPKLKDSAPSADADCPTLSIIVPACNEAETADAAMRTMLKLDYPKLQIVAINDRSTDSTGQILDRLAAEDERLKVLHISELPSGWLGKNHAMHKGSEVATGEWLLFTDADIHYDPNALRRAMTLAKKLACDHLVALPHMILHGFWEKILVSFFGVMFCIRFRPWLAMKRGTHWHVGVGAFNLIRSSTYKSIGGHAALKMDMLDDVKLGKRVKQGGFMQGVMQSGPLIAVRWLMGLGGIVRGLEKNGFAGNNYSWVMTLAGCALLIVTVCWPYAGVFLAPMIWGKLLCGGAIFGMLLCAGALSSMSPTSFLLAIFWPLSSLVMAFTLIRSAWIAFKQGGVYWRGTLYSLAELKRNQV